MEFNFDRSLAEGVEVASPGVKYTYEGKTTEAKRKIFSTIDLKKSMSSRKLSKD